MIAESSHVTPRVTPSQSAQVTPVCATFKCICHTPTPRTIKKLTTLKSPSPSEHSYTRLSMAQTCEQPHARNVLHITRFSTVPSNVSEMLQNGSPTVKELVDHVLACPELWVYIESSIAIKISLELDGLCATSKLSIMRTSRDDLFAKDILNC